METASTEPSSDEGGSAPHENEALPPPAGSQASPGDAVSQVSAGPEPAQASPFPTRSPLDGSLLSAIVPTEPAELARIVERARAAQAEWAKTPVDRRAAKLYGLKARILERAEEIADLLHHECGKPVEEAAL